MASNGCIMKNKVIIEELVGELEEWPVHRNDVLIKDNIAEGHS